MPMFNTGNPVGSTAPKDLSDNAQVFDKLVTGSDPRVPDRLGNLRISWRGVEYEFQNAQEGRQQAFDQDQAQREQEFENFLNSSGYVDIGDYGPGLVLTARNQYFVRDGYAYRAANGTTLPYTTTGNWALEQDNFVLVQSDDILRQELAAEDGATLVGFENSATGSVPRDAGAKFQELVSVNDFSSLRLALEAGAMVRVPASVASLNVSTADAPTVLRNLWRVSAEGDLVINIAGGVSAANSSDFLCRVGVRNSTIKLRGVPATETKATAVTSVTGTAGNWLVTYTLASAAGVAVGDFAKLFDVGPLPLLMGDNAAATILRNYPLKGELYNPARVNAGSATVVAGGNTVTLNGVGPNFMTSMLPGDLFTIKGQTGVITNVSVAGTVGTVTVNVTWDADTAVAGSTAFYVTRANAGTVGTGGVASATVTGAGSAFSTEGNVGDAILAQGAIHRINAIANDGSMTLDKTVNWPVGTPYSILQSAAALHGGVHEVTAVSGNQVTLRNYCTPKPPINGVSVDEFRIIKTVLKQNGTGDGFVFDQNGSLREIDDMVIVGPGSGAGVGLLLQARIPTETSEGGVSFGDVTQQGLRGTLLCEENVGVTRFGRGAMAADGCLLTARKAAFTNNLELGVWALEGSDVVLRRSLITSGGTGLQVNPGATVKITEIITVGCQGDGMRTEAGAVIYGEGPVSVANAGMNIRILDTHRAHFTDGASLLSSLSGLYIAGGSARFDRMVIGGCGRSAIEMVEAAELIADKVWASGTSNIGGQGFGVNLGNGCRVLSTNSAIRSNLGADIQMTATAVNVQATFQACRYGNFTGVTRLNSPNSNGSVIWDGLGADTGTSVPAIGAATGSTGTVSGATLAWTRDKDRYQFDGRVTVTALGDWAGYLTVALPFTALANTAVAVVNQSTGAVLSGYVSGNQLRIYSAAGAFPVAAGNIVVFGGVIRA